MVRGVWDAKIKIVTEVADAFARFPWKPARHRGDEVVFVEA
jgi:hypothetical protein